MFKKLQLFILRLLDIPSEYVASFSSHESLQDGIYFDLVRILKNGWPE